MIFFKPEADVEDEAVAESGAGAGEALSRPPLGALERAARFFGAFSEDSYSSSAPDGSGIVETKSFRKSKEGVFSTARLLENRGVGWGTDKQC